MMMRMMRRGRCTPAWIGVWWIGVGAVVAVLGASSSPLGVSAQDAASTTTRSTATADTLDAAANTFARFLIRSSYGAAEPTSADVMGPLQADIGRHLRTSYPTLEGASVEVQRPKQDVLLVVISNITELDSTATLQEDLVAGSVLIFHRKETSEESFVFRADPTSFAQSTNREDLSADLSESVEPSGTSGYTHGQAAGLFFGCFFGVLFLAAFVFLIVHRSNARLVVAKPAKPHRSLPAASGPFTPFQADNPMRYASFASISHTSQATLIPQTSASSA